MNINEQGAKAPTHKKTKEMNNEEELIEWAKANLQEVQVLKDRAEKAERAEKCGRDCYSVVGEVIKARRQELNMTQRQLGDEVGMLYNHVIGYEKGKRGMTIQTLMKFCSALGIELKLNGVIIK